MANEAGKMIDRETRSVSIHTVVLAAKHHVLKILQMKGEDVRYNAMTERVCKAVLLPAVEKYVEAARTLTLAQDALAVGIAHPNTGQIVLEVSNHVLELSVC